MSDPTDNDASTADSDELPAARFEKEEVVIYDVPKGFPADDYPLLILEVTDRRASDRKRRKDDGEALPLHEIFEEVESNDRLYKTHPLALADGELYAEGTPGYTPESLMRPVGGDDE